MSQTDNYADVTSNAPNRGFRGGNFQGIQQGVRVAARGAFTMDHGLSVPEPILGLRCARD
jgi:hypothetical protein